MAFADYCYQCHMLWTCKDHTANQFEPIKAQKMNDILARPKELQPMCFILWWYSLDSKDCLRLKTPNHPSLEAKLWPNLRRDVGIAEILWEMELSLVDFLGFVDPFVSLSSSPLDITMSLLIISPLRGSTYTHREKQPEEETDDRAMRACWWPRVNSRLQATTPSRRPCLPLHLQAFASHVSLNSSDENSGFYWLFAQPAKSFLFCIEDSWLPLGFTSQIGLRGPTK